MHDFSLRKVSPAKQLLIQQVGFVTSKHFFQHLSHATHWFKKFKDFRPKCLHIKSKSKLDYIKLKSETTYQFFEKLSVNSLLLLIGWISHKKVALNFNDVTGKSLQERPEGSLKFMFSKKATKINEIFTVNLKLCSKCQIYGEDLVIFCGLLRKH